MRKSNRNIVPNPLFAAVAVLIFAAAAFDIAAQSCPGMSFVPAAPVAVGSYPAAVKAADFNSDGRPDLASVDYFGGSVSIALALPEGGFAPAISYGGLAGPYALETGDVDADGDIDIVAVDPVSHRVAVFRNDGTADRSRLRSFTPRALRRMTLQSLMLTATEVSIS